MATKVTCTVKLKQWPDLLMSTQRGLGSILSSVKPLSVTQHCYWITGVGNTNTYFLCMQLWRKWPTKWLRESRTCDSRVLASEMVPSELLLLRPCVSSLYSEQDWSGFDVFHSPLTKQICEWWCPTAPWLSPLLALDPVRYHVVGVFKQPGRHPDNTELKAATNSSTTLGQLRAGSVSSAKPWGYCNFRRDCEPEPRI